MCEFVRIASPVTLAAIGHCPLFADDSACGRGPRQASCGRGSLCPASSLYPLCWALSAGSWPQVPGLAEAAAGVPGTPVKGLELGLPQTPVGGGGAKKPSLNHEEEEHRSQQRRQTRTVLRQMK